MRINSLIKYSTLALLLGLQLSLPYYAFAAAATEDQSHVEGADTVPDGSIFDSLNSIIDETQSLTADAAITKSVQLSPTDYKYLQTWLAFAKELKAYDTTHPGALSEYQANRTIPSQIQADFKSKVFPLFDIKLISVIDDLVTNQKTKVGAANGLGHDYLGVSRLVAGYDSDQRQFSKEGERKQIEVDQAPPISGHSLTRSQAADISALDYIRCTKVTYEGTKVGEGKVTKTVKEKPVPIQFSWQTNSQSTNPLSAQADGRPGPSSLQPAFGTSGVGSLQKIGLQDVAQTLSNVIGSTGVGAALDISQLLPPSKANNSVTDILTNAALAQPGQILGAKDLQLQGKSLGENLALTGASQLSSAFNDQFPLQSLTLNTVDAASRDAADRQLGSRFLGAGYTFTGDTRTNFYNNLGSQYLTGQILRLQTPTSDLANMPIKTTADLYASLGKIVVSQRLNVDQSLLSNGDVRAQLGDRFSQLFVTNATEADRQLNLPVGSSAAFGNSGNAADYFKLVGKTTIDTALKTTLNITDVGQADAARLADATGISIHFDPAEIYFPFDINASKTPVLTVTATDASSFSSEIDQIRSVYGNLISDAGWTTFAANYKQPAPRAAGQPELVTEDQIRSWLAANIVSNEDLIRPLLDPNATLPTDYLMRLNAHAWTGLFNQPMQKIAVLRYLEDGTTMTQTVPGTTYQTPLVNFDDATTAKLGLLAGDWDLIDHGLYQAVVEPRLANDMLVEAINGVGTNPNYQNGYPVNPVYTDSFMTGRISALSDALHNLTNLSAQSSQQATDLLQYLTNLKPADWQPTLTQSSSTLVHNIFLTIGQKVEPLLPLLSTDNRAKIAQPYAELVAGRTFVNASDLHPTIDSSQSLNLSDTTLSDVLQGKSLLSDTVKKIGADYIATYVTNTPDPVALSADLITAASQTTDAKITNLYQNYQSDWDTTANLYTGGVNSLSQDGLSGRELLNLIGGVQLPAIRNIDTIIQESMSNMPGNLFTLGSDQTGVRVGLNQVLSSMGLQTPASSDPLAIAAKIPELLLNQRAGVQWGSDALSILKANSSPSAMFSVLGISANIPSDPLAAAAYLKDNKNWQGIDIAGAFTNRFGDPGFAAAGRAFQNVFTQGANPQTVTDAIAANIRPLVPTIDGIDTVGLVTAIAQKNPQSVLDYASQGVASVLGSGLSGILPILTNTDHAPATLVNQAVPLLINQISGGQDIPQVKNLVNLATSYILQGTGSSVDFGKAASDFASAFNLPFAGMAQNVVRDPTSFGLAMGMAAMNSELSQAGISISQNDLMRAFVGVSPAERQQIAASVTSNIGSVKLDPQDISALVNTKVSQIQASAQRDLGYSMIEAQKGLPHGFMKSVFEGSDTDRIKAALGGALQFGNLPPEANAAANALLGSFNGQGFDASKLTQSAGAALDGEMSKLAGIPIPSGFSNNLAQLAQGKITADQFGQNYGSYGINLAGGMLDKEIGLPSGTSAAVGQMALKLSQATDAVSQATSQLGQGGFGSQLQAASNLNAANIQLGSVEAAGASLLINMIAGDKITQLESSIGLPSGTVSMLMGAGLQALFTGAAFATVLSTALPIFAAGLVLTALLSGKGLEGIFGGGSKTQTFTDEICTAGGYYPYVKKTDAAEQKDPANLYDPNIPVNLLTADQLKADPKAADEPIAFHPIKDRMKPDDVAKKLALWPGYFGEFYGRQGFQPQTYQVGLTAAARWKIRQLLGELLTMCQRFTPNPADYSESPYRINQIILYELPANSVNNQKWSLPGDLTQNGNYLLPYDSNTGKTTSMQNDKRFVGTDSTGNTLGYIDQPSAKCGYGTGTAFSMVGLQAGVDVATNQQTRPIYRGIWQEMTKEYEQHVHFSF